MSTVNQQSEVAQRAVFPMKLGDTEFVFDGERTYVMGVMNLSPESNIKHSIVASLDEARARAQHFRELGVSIIDLGAQSSHFDNVELPPEVEIERMRDVLPMLVDDGWAVSIDTWKPEVAAFALESGAALLNDTGGLQRPEMLDIAAAHCAPTIVMYIEGADPLHVGNLEFRDDKSAQVAEVLRDRIALLAERGMHDVLLDPGISINYRSDYYSYCQQQLRVIRGIDTVRELGKPVMIPVPRKAHDHWRHAYLAMSLEYRADVIRVHDVEDACDLAALYGRLGRIDL